MKNDKIAAPSEGVPMTNKEQQGFPPERETAYSKASELPDQIYFHEAPDSHGFIMSYWSDSPVPDVSGGIVVKFVPAALLAEAVREARSKAFEEAAAIMGKGPEWFDRYREILAMRAAKAASTEGGKGG